MSSVVARRPLEVLLASLRRWSSIDLRCASEAHFAFAISCTWALLYNATFWEQTLRAMWHPTPGGVAFLLSLFVLAVALQALLLLLMPNPIAMRAAASCLFVVAAASAYFCNEYGAIMNKDMLRNVLETDSAEVAGLINLDLLVEILVLGILPGLLVWRVSLPKIRCIHRARQRIGAIATTMVICVGALFACSASYAVFFREHKPIRYTLLPAAPIASLIAVLSRAGDRPAEQPMLDPAADSHSIGAASRRPLVLFVVIGETARAENFQLGGYGRDTNPNLEHIDDLVYFDQTISCGTSTALSVPCMFSSYDREHFEPKNAAHTTNLLDALVAAGFDVEWRDNNAGCKGVCARVSQISYRDNRADPSCIDSYCYDEVMLTDLPARLRKIKRDTVIVFHQIGSHGPAYAKRYPPELGRFKPACRSNRLHECTAQEVVNAYDNTIAYTDRVLARQIGMLREASQQVDGALLYVSDHGESLGEQSIYLHGMPYTFAPWVQKHVPMLLWASPQYQARVGLRLQCVRARAHRALSHDNLYHTVLGLTEVRNKAYDASLDISASCRDGTLGFEHE